MAAKRKYTELDINHKKRIIDLIDKKVSQRNIAEQFGISKTTVVNIGQHRDDILKMWSDNCNGERRRKMRKTENEMINIVVLKIVELCRSKDIPISGVMLQKKAKEVAMMLSINDFQASNGWLQSFLKRNNISLNKTLCGDTATADTVQADEWEEKKLLELNKEYRPEDVFNADELALFYRQILKKNFVKKGDRCKRGEMAEERLSVLLCCSSVGEKLKPLVIGSVARPRIFKQEGVKPENLPATWRFNNKSWMTQVIFEEWLTEVNEQMKRQNRHILLFIDNATSHSTTKIFSNVTIQFLHPNLMFEMQPLDRIIKVVKDHYRSKMLEYIVSGAENCVTKKEFHKSITVLHAVRWLYSAWQEIPQQMIEKCFRRASLINCEIEDDTGEQATRLSETIRTLPDNFQVDLASVTDIEEADRHLIIHEVLPGTIDELLNQLIRQTTNNGQTTINDLDTQSEDEEGEDKGQQQTEDVLDYEQALKSVKDLIRFSCSENLPDIENLFALYNHIEQKWIKNRLALKQMKI